MKTEEAIEVFQEIEKLRKEIWDHVDTLKLLREDLILVKTSLETKLKPKNKKYFRWLK